MPVLSWDEIRSRALKFQNEWKDETNENAEAKTFWNDFFEVFGISRRRVATFEEAVKIEGNTKFVDLLWKGTLLIEHKSKGKDLERAYKQATDYFRGIKDRDLPQYVLVSDFARFKVYDLDNDTIHQFNLEDLHKNVQLFSFIAGYEQHEIKPQDPVNIKAAEMMGKIHDSLESINYTGHDLDTLLVRLVFCLFADDTGIFNKGIFKDFIEDNTNEDGTDLAPKIQYLFEILDTPIDERIVDDSIYSEFPYVNGSLFTEHLKTAVFNAEMREILLECSRLDWGKISPAIFGSLFQSAMDREKRRALGAHYTSEENIMKVIQPLFLDDLRDEFEEIQKRKRNKLNLLESFQENLSNLNFFDPACGSGNFLILAYREVRQLELEVLKEINYTKYGVESYQLDLSLDFNEIIKCNVDQFYGIEIDSFSAQIAQVALWIVDHQMNIEASLYFGASFARLPLSEHANIVNGNSLEIKWVDVLDPRDCDYILGNPPFVGATYQTKEQKQDIKKIFNNISKTAKLDYVSCWFMLASRYIYQSDIKTAFVSTNSITQGEQLVTLWNELFNYDINIVFAHKTFEWSNNAKGNAKVHCVIIGFISGDNSEEKKLYDENNVTIADNISPYLIDAPPVLIKSRRQPILNVPEIKFGSMPRDGGNLVLSVEEKDEFIAQEPITEKWIKPYVGSRELINNGERYCLWLLNANPSEINSSKLITDRINRVREFRLNSKAKATRKFAETPAIFCQIAQPDSDYIAIPKTSSSKREYVPIKLLNKEVIGSDLIFIIPGDDLSLFGILQSKIHNVWLKNVCGRLKSDYRYSKDIVYNNFPFPELNDNQRSEIKLLVVRILEIRKRYVDSSLADLYNPITMPVDLQKAHKALDKEVEKAYRRKKFNSDNERLAYLFDLYTKITK